MPNCTERLAIFSLLLGAEIRELTGVYFQLKAYRGMKVMLMVCWEFYSDTIWDLPVKHTKQPYVHNFYPVSYSHNLGKVMYEK